jgi:hypothetical protein
MCIEAVLRGYADDCFDFDATWASLEVRKKLVFGREIQEASVA